MSYSDSASAQMFCASDAESRAERVRLVQTELMVAALQCRSRPSLGLVKKYNSFVTAFSTDLKGNAQTLTNYYVRQFGAGHRKELDSHITLIANSASLASIRNADYCSRSADFVSDLLDAGPGSANAYELIDTPNFLAQRPGICTNVVTVGTGGVSAPSAPAAVD